MGITRTDIVFKKVTVTEKVTGRETKQRKDAGIIHKKATGIGKDKKEIIGIKAIKKKSKQKKSRM